MKKNSKLLIGLLTIVILAVIGLSAYAYQKQQALNSNKPKVENKKEDSKQETLLKLSIILALVQLIKTIIELIAKIF